MQYCHSIVNSNENTLPTGHNCIRKIEVATWFKSNVFAVLKI